jgi:hypothetical protein
MRLPSRAAFPLLLHPRSVPCIHHGGGSLYSHHAAPATHLTCISLSSPSFSPGPRPVHGHVMHPVIALSINEFVPACQGKGGGGLDGLDCSLVPGDPSWRCLAACCAHALYIHTLPATSAWCVGLRGGREPRLTAFGGSHGTMEVAWMHYPQHLLFWREESPSTTTASALLHHTIDTQRAVDVQTQRLGRPPADCERHAAQRAM